MKEVLIERFVEASTSLCKIYELKENERVFLEKIFCEDAAWDYAASLIRKSGEEGVIRYKKIKHKCCKNCKYYYDENWFNKCEIHKEYNCDNKSESWCRDYELKGGIL